MTTQRAQDFLEKSMELCLRPRSGDRQRLIAFILREVVDELQYYNFGGGEDMILDARAILDLADEMEALQ